MEMPTVVDLSLDQINQSLPQSNKNLRPHNSVKITQILFKQFNVLSITFFMSITLLIYFWSLYIYYQVSDQLLSCVLYQCGAKFRPDIQYRSEFHRMLISIPLFGGISHIIIGFITIQMYGYFSEFKYGKLKYCTVLFLSGYSSNLLSSLIYPYNVTVGSEGIVFGVLTLYGFIILQQKTLGQYKKLIFGIYIVIFFINFIPIISINQIDIASIFGGWISAVLLTIYFEKFEIKYGRLLNYGALSLEVIFIIVCTTLLYTIKTEDVRIDRFC